MKKAKAMIDLLNELPATVDSAKFTADMLRAIARLRKRPLDIYYAGPRSLRVDGVTMMSISNPSRP